MPIKLALHKRMWEALNASHLSCGWTNLSFRSSTLEIYSTVKLNALLQTHIRNIEGKKLSNQLGC